MNSRDIFIDACNCKNKERMPVWLLRQAGRYLPGYRELREKYSFLEIIKKPELIVEVSLEPYEKFGVDAVIVFSDILVPISQMGVRLGFSDAAGPELDRKIRCEKDLGSLVTPHVRRTLDFVFDGLNELKYKLSDETALIGFVGAPWTLACYLIEGKSTDFSGAVSLLKNNAKFISKLTEHITETILEFAVEQVRAGADAIQIFDTWAGLVDADIYKEMMVPQIARICGAVKKAGGIPILFMKDSEKFLDDTKDCGALVFSLGSKTNLKSAHKILGDKIATQGNLDPEILLKSPAEVINATKKLIDEIENKNGHIMNLGHGVLPKTRVDSVKAFVDTVKNYHP